MRKLELLIILFGVNVSFAAVHHIDADVRSGVLAGAEFGSAGSYERIEGRAYFRVDPKLASNRIVRDLDLAPRDEDGNVEFSADLYVLKPRDPAKSNGTVLFEVSNRGGKGMLAMFNRTRASANPSTADDFGDRFLLDRGFTLVWLGWQFDVRQQAGMLRAYVPLASNGAQPITGLVRSEFVPSTRVGTMPLSDRGTHIAYAPANLNDTAAQLTVRDRNTGERTVVARKSWAFSDAAHITMASGFEPGRIYELVYTAKEPSVTGLGMAAVRDLMSFLKYGGADTLLGDQHNFMKRTIGFGTSQSGRFLRTFLYEGFNADEKGRKVFDGVWGHVAGAGRGSFNFRFAQPSRDAQPFTNFFYPTDLFPFTDLAENDPVTDATGGLLDQATKADVVPKIFYTNGSFEYWGRAASLIHTTADGKHDAPLAKDTRIYFNTGAEHGPGSFPPRIQNTRYLADPLDYRWQMRALLLAMHEWLKSGKEPPASVYPLIVNGELTPLDQLKFPHIPGIEVPKRFHTAYHVDYGPQFASAGLVTVEPPKVGAPFPAMVPQVDADGNDVSGVRLPEIQVPLGTYTGWNLRSAESGAPDEMIAFIGSFIPFPKTKSERLKTKDPRLSIEERYRGKQDYLSKSAAAAHALAAAGYLLAADEPALLERAAQMWDYLAVAK